MSDVDEPVRHVQITGARAKRLRGMSPADRLRIGADLTDTALYFARRGGKPHWSPRA